MQYSPKEMEYHTTMVHRALDARMLLENQIALFDKREGAYPLETACDVNKRAFSDMLKMQNEEYTTAFPLVDKALKAKRRQETMADYVTELRDLEDCLQKDLCSGPYKRWIGKQMEATVLEIGGHCMRLSNGMVLGSKQHVDLLEYDRIVDGFNKWATLCDLCEVKTAMEKSGLW